MLRPTAASEALGSARAAPSAINNNTGPTAGVLVRLCVSVECAKYARAPKWKAEIHILALSGQVTKRTLPACYNQSQFETRSESKQSIDHKIGLSTTRHSVPCHCRVCHSSVLCEVKSSTHPRVMTTEISICMVWWKRAENFCLYGTLKIYHHEYFATQTLTLAD